MLVEENSFWRKRMMYCTYTILQSSSAERQVWTIEKFCEALHTEGLLDRTFCDFVVVEVAAKQSSTFNFKVFEMMVSKGIWVYISGYKDGQQRSVEQKRKGGSVSWVNGSPGLLGEILWVHIIRQPFISNISISIVSDHKQAWNYSHTTDSFVRRTTRRVNENVLGQLVPDCLEISDLSLHFRPGWISPLVFVFVSKFEGGWVRRK